MKRATIFLDIDGVFTCHRVSKAIAEPGVLSVFDPTAVAFFERMAVEHNPYFVISSSWRLIHSKRSIIMMFKTMGAFKIVMNLHTDWQTLKLSDRTIEIKDWIDRRKRDHDLNGKFIIVDDAHIGKIDDATIITTTEQDGMQYKQYDMIERTLNK